MSHDTAQVTHNIAPDIDAERDLLMQDLRTAGMVQTFFQISGTGPTLLGRNGEGDPYHTDGEIKVATLVPGRAAQEAGNCYCLIWDNVCFGL